MSTDDDYNEGPSINKLLIVFKLPTQFYGEFTHVGTRKNLA